MFREVAPRFIRTGRIVGASSQTGWSPRQLLHPTSSCSSTSAQEEASAHDTELLGTDGSTQMQEQLQPGNLTPANVVEVLDRHIVGQADAKRAVAVALRNRWRRHHVPPEFRSEIVPKNILMIGPTGCGKTEIARRLAKLADAPFVKVEATKFTEVGFHGRDVDQIIRDLVDNAIYLIKQKVRSRLKEEVERIVETMILDAVVKNSGCKEELADDLGAKYEEYRKLYKGGTLDNMKIDIELPDEGRRNSFALLSLHNLSNLAELIGRPDKGSRTQKWGQRQIKVKEARGRLIEIEFEKHLNSDQIVKEAIQLAESDGIVFIDEIDKIVRSHDLRDGHDSSAEGVQRDLLPIIEGSTVNTKYGNVNTDHILFICSGAFHACKPSDMLAELQGRLPIRVELKGLTHEDFYRILTEPQANMIKQQVGLLKTEDVHLIFTDDAIKELASIAAEVNKSVDNIGARRLHTVIEKVVEDISFHAPERAGETYIIDKEKVRSSLGKLLTKTDISKFIL